MIDLIRIRFFSGSSEEYLFYDHFNISIFSANNFLFIAFRNNVRYLDGMFLLHLFVFLQQLDRMPPCRGVGRISGLHHHFQLGNLILNLFLIIKYDPMRTFLIVMYDCMK